MRIAIILLAVFLLSACAPSPAERLSAQLESFPNGKVEYRATSSYEGETIAYTLHEYLFNGLWRRDSFSEGRPEQRVIAKGGTYYRCTHNETWNCSETLGENIFLVTDRVLAMARADPANFTVTMGTRTILGEPRTCYLLSGAVDAEYCFSADGHLLFANAHGSFWGKPFEQQLEATALGETTLEDFTLPE